MVHEFYKVSDTIQQMYVIKCIRSVVGFYARDELSLISNHSNTNRVPEYGHSLSSLLRS